MKCIIPMAGEGSRFKIAGYKDPKPLIQINGKTMIEWVIETLPKYSECIFLCRSEHLQNYPLEQTLKTATNNRYKIVEVKELTEGAASTLLLAKELINNDESLFVCNSDQYAKYNRENFETLVTWGYPDGIIFTFYESHPKWSYVKRDKDGKVIQVAEKAVISNIATTGNGYYFSKGSQFVWAAEEMIRKNIRTNGEFYLAPVYNELLDEIIVPFFVDKMIKLGTPEDLEYTIKHNLLCS